MTKSIHASFSSGTNAEIEQPYTAVNKDLFPDRYSAWKDSVWQSIKHMGRPLSYQQTFDFTWKLPLNKLPLFDWLTADFAYNGTYNWTRGTDLEDGSTMGNNISNSSSKTYNARLNLETLYNHVPWQPPPRRKRNRKTSRRRYSSRPTPRSPFSTTRKARSFASPPCAPTARAIPSATRW